MLVILSDLHLTDGSTGETTSPGAFHVFAARLHELAQGAGWRANGTYHPVERVDIVLLGDILDPVRSSQWTEQEIRPWHDPHTSDFSDLIGRITDAILDHNRQALVVLRSLAEHGVGVPVGTRDGKPDTNATLRPVPVRIHYMVGNHDWFYHLPGPYYDGVRRKIIEQLGLAQGNHEPFAHDIVENEELLNAMRRHRVTARHGDLYDPLGFDGDRDTASLSDALGVELLGRFAAAVRTELAVELPTSTLSGLRQMDNIRPLLLTPVWLDGLLERTCPVPAARKRVKTVWDGMVDDFLAVDYVRHQDACHSFDLVDGFARALKFGKRLPIGWTNSIAEWLHRAFGITGESYSRFAAREQDFRNRRSKHIVYGHSHVAQSVPLDASYAEGYVLDQMYFNAGTWRRVHRRTQWAPREHEFIASDVMTYLVFFEGNERQGRPYETWSGTLGFNPSEITVHRIDPGTANHATTESIPTSKLHVRAPHFGSPHHAGVVAGHRV